MGDSSLECETELFRLFLQDCLVSIFRLTRDNDNGRVDNVDVTKP